MHFKSLKIRPVLVDLCSFFTPKQQEYYNRIIRTYRLHNYILCMNVCLCVLCIDLVDLVGAFKLNVLFSSGGTKLNIKNIVSI